MGFAVDGEKVLFVDANSFLTKKCITPLSKVQLDGAEADNIEALVYVCAVGDILWNLDLVEPCIVNELEGDVRTVSIDVK